ncbi:MAG: peroxiredoxin [Ectothiorhodospiraceae bacterium]|nr:peroxiredoxin [Ectothiorhodospiraceae bacterium]
MSIKDLSTLPDNLPIPIDDGACDHLLNARLPSITLTNTSGTDVNLSELKGTVVLFFYPMNGKPGSPPMIGWNDIPGARGCTPQVCSYKDNYPALIDLGVTVYGVSSQPLKDQTEVKNRLALPYELLNDSDFTLTNALRLPTFPYESSTYIKRLTTIVKDGLIVKVFYPVFPPNENINQVIDWIKGH